MTELETEIRARIAECGPLNLASYMSMCLSHETHGYYMSRDPFGRSGDFTTAPEISQIFGELIGLWAAIIWQSMGSPARINLVELGPGRGTLMADALRAINQASPYFMAAIKLHLVEMSPALRRKQAEALDITPQWHDSVDDLPSGPMIVLANEFFDALPIRQFVRKSAVWHERLVGAGSDGFTFTQSPKALEDGFLPRAFSNAAEGAIAEISSARDKVMAKLAALIREQNGAALIIDYGHNKTAPGDTFQAVRGHKFANPLKNPGLADLTAHVDFDALSQSAKEAGAGIHGPITQGEFLGRLGIQARAEMLKVNADNMGDINAAVERLTAPDQMGAMFKVLCVSSPSLKPPPF